MDKQRSNLLRNQTDLKKFHENTFETGTIFLRSSTTGTNGGTDHRRLELWIAQLLMA